MLGWKREPKQTVTERLALDTDAVEAAFADEEVKVLQEAAAVLGYHTGVNVTARDEANRKALAFLVEQGVTVLDPVKVTRYKLEEAHRHLEDRRTARWERSDLGGYGGVIPVHVLQLALNLKAKATEAGLPIFFTVEELREEAVVLDPFLIVTLNGSSHYVAVWDEPRWR